MKIDQDESSDELTIYRPDGLKEGYEIVDTPGLFGTKTKEINGRDIRLSQITRDYIASAHIVIYVCDAVNSLKDSHKEALKIVLRDLGKLSAAIFVINKMDEAGVLLNDDKSYRKAVEIKQNTFLSRLDSILTLSEKEKRQLRIECISANPYGRGLDVWFKTMDDYKAKSRIENVNSQLQTIIRSLSKKELQANVDTAIVKDLTIDLTNKLAGLQRNLIEPQKIAKRNIDELEIQLHETKNEIIANKGRLRKRLEFIRKEILTELDKIIWGEEMQNFLDYSFGTENDKATGYIMIGRINQAVEECVEANQGQLRLRENKMIQNIDQINTAIEQGIKYAAAWLKTVKVSGETVKQIRNFAFSSYKFKPWGAIKLGTKLTNILGGIGLLADIVMFFYKRDQEKKEKQKVLKAKKSIKEVTDGLFSDLFAKMDNSEIYLQEFAPGFIKLNDYVEEQRTILEQLHLRSMAIKKLHNDLSIWSGRNVEDVEYVEF